MTTYVVECKRSIDAPFAWRTVPEPADFIQLVDAVERERAFHAAPCYMPYSWETRIVEVSRKVLL
jgi:hypothetical protein